MDPNAQSTSENIRIEVAGNTPFDGVIRNFYYDLNRGLPLTTEYLGELISLETHQALIQIVFAEDSKYGNTKTSNVKNDNYQKFGTKHLFDGVNEDSGYEKNWVTSSDGKHPWFQVKFTETIFIAGLEIRAFGFEVNKPVYFSKAHII